MIRIEGKEYSSLKQALADVQESQIIEIDGCIHEQVVIDKPNITVRAVRSNMISELMKYWMTGSREGLSGPIPYSSMQTM